MLALLDREAIRTTRGAISGKPAARVVNRLLQAAEELRSYPSWIAGIRYRSDDGTHRGRYCAALQAGCELELVAEPDNPHDPQAVAIYHAGRHLGYVPKRHHWVAESLGEGDTLSCVVTALELTGLFRKRARHVHLQISVVEDGVLRSVTRRVLGAGHVALRTAGVAGQMAGTVTVSAAQWGGQNLLLKPTKLIVQGLDGAAEMAVRKPYRKVRRIFYFIVGAGFAFLILVFGILVLLHTLPQRINFSIPSPEQSRAP